MTDALLVADQHLNEGFLASASLRPHARGADLIFVDQTSQLCDFLPCDESRLIRTELNGSLDDSRTTVDAHLSRAQHALEHLDRFQQRAEMNRQFHQEVKWLAENGQSYSGRWVALDGDCLLAVGTTSREVFSKVANRAQPPLVVRIDEKELPFAGW